MELRINELLILLVSKLVEFFSISTLVKTNATLLTILYRLICCIGRIFIFVGYKPFKVFLFFIEINFNGFQFLPFANWSKIYIYIYYNIIIIYDYNKFIYVFYNISYRKNSLKVTLEACKLTKKIFSEKTTYRRKTHFALLRI